MTRPSGPAGWGPSVASVYTRIVSLTQRSISIVVLAALTALPVAGTVCAMLCDPAATATASAHHGADKNCEEPARPSTEVQIQGVSEHHCNNHYAAVRQVATTAAERADGAAAGSPLVSTTVDATSSTLPALKAALEYITPPGSAPPTTTPLVLRV